MAFVTENLSWVRQLSRFTDEEQKVLLALSDERYNWRTKAGIIGVTQLTSERVESVLAGLIQDGFVQPSFSRSGDLIYRLADRPG